MAALSMDLVAEEMLRRTQGRFRLEDFCFPEQLSFIREQSRFATGVCSRRAGKTVGCAADLIDTALSTPEVVCLYITLARTNAKRLIWPELLKLNREHNLAGKPNEQELSLTFPNGSVIYCSGAKDATEIEKFRGLALKKCYIDEAQSFRHYIRELIDDVISKALFDHNGRLRLIGTPGPVPAGFFYDCTQSKKWAHHAWTMLQNPHLKRKSGRDPMDLIQEDMERMGVSIDHPKIQRECFGRWVVDGDSLVFKYDPARNGYGDEPKWTSTVLGIDLGFEDSDAIAVLGWSDKDPRLFLLEEKVVRKQGITELAEQIQALIAKYDPNRVVMDTGGLGKKIAEEIQRRHAIPVVAAEKARKFEYIELLNDSLRTAKLFARTDSQFAHDCTLVEWDKDPENPERLRISDRYHSDICDAVLYAYREALHWLFTPAEVKPEHGTEQWFQAEEEAIVSTLEDQFAQKNIDPWERGLSNEEYELG